MESQKFRGILHNLLTRIETARKEIKKEFEGATAGQTLPAGPYHDAMTAIEMLRVASYMANAAITTLDMTAPKPGRKAAGKKPAKAAQG